MKINKLGNILLIIFVLLLIINVVSAEDSTLVGADNGKLMLDTDSDSSISVAHANDGAKLGATDSHETLKAGEVGNYTELQSLIDSNPYGTITLDKDYAYVDSDTVWMITLSPYITINGNGHKISGEYNTMSFYVPAGTGYVTLNNITFVNGNGNSMLWVNGNDCVINDCTFENNKASGYGGAVRMAGQFNTISNSKFIDNAADSGGSAVYLIGYNNTVTGSTFENNDASSSGYGGAIFVGGHDNLVNDSTFKSNKAPYGGAIYLYGNDNTVNNSTFENNDDYNILYGGAIYMGGYDNLINYSTFENNHAFVAGSVYLSGQDNVINNSIMNYNYADSTAGAVFINGANTIDNSKFSENYVNYDQSKGAAIRVDGVNAEILNSEFDNHYAVDGGAIHWVGANGTIKGSKFNKNTAKSAGGAILWEGVNGTIEGSEFNENTAKSAGAIDVRNNLVINNTKFNKNSASTFAGALYIQHDNAVVNNSEFNKNYANEAGAIEIHGMNITIDCSNFTENKAMPESEVAHTNYGRGGAILIRDLENNQDLNNTIRGSIFKHNEAKLIAGAIYVESKGNIINGSEFYYNTAINTGGAVQLYQENNIIDNSCFEHNNASFGGALYIYYGNSLVNNTNMSYNNASAGGAIYVFLGKNVTVDNSRFESNFAFSSEENLELDDESRALANGGAIYWGSDNGVIDHSEFSNNYVSTSKQNNAYGGAVHWVGNNATINNTKFTLNWVNNNGGFSEGGALSISDDNATVENCIFEKNVVYANGGAIHWMGDHGVIYNSTFIENNASSEGGAINGVGKNLLINNSTFTRNKALWYVGGALALDAYGTIDNSTFIENSAYKGGAIHWIDEGACLVNNSYFYKNHAMYAGGAISCDFYYYHADKYLQNTRFINNTCQNYGGAIASLDTEIDNCTFINNSANMGGAIHSYDSKINGSHFSDNSAKYGNDIYHSGTLDLIDLEVPDENIVYVPSDLAEIVRYNIGNSTRLMNNSYIGMCFERNSLLPKYGAYDESLQGLINVKSKDSIVEYLKLLIYDSFNSMEEVYPHEDDNYVLYPEGYEDYPDLIKDDKSNWVPISRTDYYSRAVHVFSDHDFRNSKHPVVQKILNDYNNGIRISQDQTKMVNGTMIKYHFSTLMSPASQSLFLFLITPIPKIDKTYLNTTDFVTVNDTVAFNITVNNTGDKPLVNITIKEIYNSTELEYIGHSDNKTWIKNNDTFTFYHDPDVGDIVIYNIYLENTCGKNLENTVFGNVYDPTQLEFVKCANADLIKNPDGTFLFVDELRGHRNKTLSLYFKILNKDEELAVMTPKIIKYSFSEDNTVLSTEGNIIVKKTYNHTFNDTNGNDFVVYDICLNNTCDSPLENITFNKVYDLTELEFINCTNVNLTKNADGTFFYSGVIKAHENVTSRLCFKVLNNNIDKTNRTLNVVKYYRIDSNLISQDGRMSIEREYVGRFSPINVGEAYTFTIWFKTLTNGTLVNNVSLNAHALREVLNATNKTTVYKPNLTVEKIALNSTVIVYVGDHIAFNITVNNTGDSNLYNLTINEIFNSTELKFIRYSDNTTWIRNNNTFIYNGTMGIGDIIAFNITVNNTGDCAISNMTISNIFDSTELVYFKGADGKVLIRNGETFILNQTLGIGECKNFTLWFKTLVKGNLTEMKPVVTKFNVTGDGSVSPNVVVSRAMLETLFPLHKCESSTLTVWFKTLTNGTLVNNVTAKAVGVNETPATNNTTVYRPNMTVEKITLNKTVYLGNQTSFTIIVRNTGDCDLGNVTVVEKSYTGLVLDSYVNGTGKWKRVGDKFVLDGVLAKGASASFRVIFNTTVSGNFTNVVVANSNVTKNKTTENKTVVVPVRVNVTKVWEDNKNQDGIRHTSVTIILLADGKEIKRVVLSQKDNWTYIFNELPMVKDGKVINYKVSEIPIENYTMKIINKTVDDFTVIVANNTYKFDVVNNHTPLVTSVNVTKVWNDEDNQDGIRPDNITVILRNDTGVVDEFVLNSTNGWKHTFPNLPVYINNGTLINYTVVEKNVPKGYVNKTVKVDSYNYIINNNHTTEVTSVNVTKDWNDDNNQDGIRPKNITVVLMNDTGVVAEIVLNASNGWKGNFSNLPVYVNNGTLINYTVAEKTVPDGYDMNIVKIDGYNYVINNNHTSEVTSVNVTKVWNDNDDQDGVRSADVTVVLKAYGDVVGTVTLNASNNWSASFSDLPVYNEGKLIEYSVEEVSVANYTSVVSSDSAYSFIVNNTHVPVVTSVDVVKVWNDANDQDGIRPASVTVVLLADGNMVGTVVLNANNNWYASFEDLPVYSNGMVIEYTVQEVSVANYTSVVSSDSAYSFIVNNTHVPVVTSVDVVKVWNDANDQDGLRPSEITVVLLADGNVIGTATLSANNNWYASFEDLPVYSNGKLIKYSIEEISVANYTSAISNDTAYSFTVNNTHVPLITVVNITKVWRDDNNKNEEPVKVIIYADGVQVANVTLYPGNDWKFTFDDLPAYKDGKKINYTIGVVEGNRTVNMTGDNGNFTIIAEPVYNPDMTVQKITLDTEVEVGDLVSFEIVVENTGDCDLTGVYVIDNEYSEGLVFEYMEPNDDWTYEGNGKFTYNGILGVGESTSFIVVFTATTVGFKVNTVTAGNNLTNKTVNSTNTTNVTEEVPEPDVPEDEPDVPQKHHVPKQVKPDTHATGNPILLLLLALVIPIIRRKQK